MEEKTSSEAIGLRIKELREKNHETQNDLATAISCNQNNISKIEKGGSLTSDNLIAIANHYHVSLDYLCKGEGGFDLLDTLTKFIRFQYERTSGIDETDKSHLIPHIAINCSLYNCMRQISLARKNADMPESIKEQWINQAIEEFNNGKDSDNYKDFISFIALEQTVLQNNPEFVSLIKKHIVE